MAVHVSLAFEQLFMPAAALGNYIQATRCLPLFAAARCVTGRIGLDWSGVDWIGGGLVATT